MVSSVTSGGNATQPVQQSRQADQAQRQQADQVRQQQAEQAQQRQAEQARQSSQPKPTVNTEGQVTGTVVNTTA